MEGKIPLAGFVPKKLFQHLTLFLCPPQQCQRAGKEAWGDLALRGCILVLFGLLQARGSVCPVTAARAKDNPWREGDNYP